MQTSGKRRSLVGIEEFDEQDIACIDASKRIFQAIEEVEKLIGEDASNACLVNAVC